MAGTTAARKAELEKSLRSNEAKWTTPVIALGWMALPSVLLDKQPALGIDAIDLNILLQLMKYWWKKDDLPFPKKETLAELVGVSPSTIRKRIKRMESEGLVRRIKRHDKRGGQQSNFYNFDGLIEKIQPHAKEALALRKKQDEERTELRRRKNVRSKPKLEIVSRGKAK